MTDFFILLQIHTALNKIMGASLKKFIFRLLGQKSIKICMVGLESSGKTTILYKLHLGEVIATTPSIGFNVETLKLRNFRIEMWDLSGFFRYRPLWTSLYPGSSGFIFVVDSEDRLSLAQAKEELDNLLSHPDSQQAPLLILANKQDLPNSMTVVEIFDKLELFRIKSRLWFIQGCCALSGDGLAEGMKQLIRMVTRFKKGDCVNGLNV